MILVTARELHAANLAIAHVIHDPKDEELSDYCGRTLVELIPRMCAIALQLFEAQGAISIGFATKDYIGRSRFITFAKAEFETYPTLEPRFQDLPSWLLAAMADLKADGISAGA